MAKKSVHTVHTLCSSAPCSLRLSDPCSSCWSRPAVSIAHRCPRAQQCQAPTVPSGSSPRHRSVRNPQRCVGRSTQPRASRNQVRNASRWVALRRSVASAAAARATWRCCGLLGRGQGRRCGLLLHSTTGCCHCNTVSGAAPAVSLVPRAAAVLAALALQPPAGVGCAQGGAAGYRQRRL